MTLSRLIIKVIRLGLILAVSHSLLQPSPVRAAGVCRVNWAAPGAVEDGSSWETAYINLQDALHNADCLEIWVATGVYRPTGSLDRTISFELRGNLALYGGFFGTETERDARDWTANPTVLSGEINGDDNLTGNSYHVVRDTSNSPSAILDGFTITAGNANGPGLEANGGGMFIVMGFPALRNLIIVKNSADRTGGGLFSILGEPNLTNISFIQNNAQYGGGMYSYSGSPVLSAVVFFANSAREGGGLLIEGDAELGDITFALNVADEHGGGLYVGEGTLALNRVTFSGNSAGGNGGGLFNKGSLALENVTISGNVSGGWGGGIASYGYSASTNLTHTTLSGNFSNTSGGGMVNMIGSETTIENTIFWGNSAETEGAQLYNKVPDTGLPAGTVVFHDSIVQDGCPEASSCSRVLATDPYLGELGDHGGLTRTIPISVDSAARDTASDAACLAVDQRGLTRPQGRGCDMGAFELVYFETNLPLVMR